MYLFGSESYNKIFESIKLPKDYENWTIIESPTTFDDPIKPVFNININWNNVIIAGGAVVSLLTGTQPNDIDIYLYGFDDENKYEDKIEELLRTLSTGKSYYTRTAYCITIHNDLKIQIILTNDKTPEEIINVFDIDACRCYYQAGQVYMTEECIRALKLKAIMVEMDRKTSVFEYRLKKYNRKGFDLLFEDLDMKKAIHTNKKHGLGYILQDGATFDKSYYWDTNESTETIDTYDWYQLEPTYNNANPKWFIFSKNIKEIMRGKQNPKYVDKTEELLKFKDLGFETKGSDLKANSQKYMNDTQRYNWFGYNELDNNDNVTDIEESSDESDNKEVPNKTEDIKPYISDIVKTLNVLTERLKDF